MINTLTLHRMGKLLHLSEYSVLASGLSTSNIDLLLDFILHVCIPLFLLVYDTTCNHFLFRQSAMTNYQGYTFQVQIKRLGGSCLNWCPRQISYQNLFL